MFGRVVEQIWYAQVILQRDGYGRKARTCCRTACCQLQNYRPSNSIRLQYALVRLVQKVFPLWACTRWRSAESSIWIKLSNYEHFKHDHFFPASGSELTWQIVKQLQRWSTTWRDKARKNKSIKDCLWAWWPCDEKELRKASPWKPGIVVQERVLMVCWLFCRIVRMCFLFYSVAVSADGVGVRGLVRCVRPF